MLNNPVVYGSGGVEAENGTVVFSGTSTDVWVVAFCTIENGSLIYKDIENLPDSRVIHPVKNSIVFILGDVVAEDEATPISGGSIISKTIKDDNYNFAMAIKVL